MAQADGQVHRQESSFRNFISANPNAAFPAEKNRYVVYLNYVGPWAHRVNIVLHLKGLTGIIQIVVMDYELGPEGWCFSGRLGTAPEDSINDFKFFRGIYLKADSNYNARCTVPCLWDKKKNTIVNNESSEIIPMLYTQFDAFIPKDRTEAIRPLFPKHLRAEIDEFNEWVYNTVDDGVYKAGFFATTQ